MQSEPTMTAYCSRYVGFNVRNIQQVLSGCCWHAWPT